MSFYVQNRSSRPKIDPPCQFQQLVVLSAGPIPRNSIHLLMILSYFTDLLDMSFSLSLHFLPVLGLETSVCSILKFYPVFLGS